MKTATKNITASLFTLLGLAPFIFVVLTGIKQQEIRHNMKRQLETRMLHTVTLAKKNVHWLNEGKELIIDGRLFDVRSFRLTGNGEISFTGLFDDEETALVNKVKTNQQNADDTGGKLIARFFQLLQSSCSNSPSDNFFPSANNNHFPGLEQDLASAFITILSPPPQV